MAKVFLFPKGKDFGFEEDKIHKIFPSFIWYSEFSTYCKESEEFKKFFTGDRAIWRYWFDSKQERVIIVIGMTVEEYVIFENLDHEERFDYVMGLAI